MGKLVGRTLAKRYYVDAFLGSDPTAESYKVMDKVRRVYLTIKVYKSNDKVFMDRLRSCAQTLERLQHPNIVRFYGLEQDGDMVILLWDFVEGTNLQEEIARSQGKPFSAVRILEIMRPICSALQYIHSQGMIHACIEAGNILVDKTGQILVKGFGDHYLTDVYTSFWTIVENKIVYSSQYYKDRHNPIPQSDVYALGTILYELLTGGEKPYTGERSRITGANDHSRVLLEQIRLPPTPIRQHNPDISPELEMIVMRCLEKDHARRFESVQALLKSLEAVPEVLIAQLPPAQGKIKEHKIKGPDKEVTHRIPVRTDQRKGLIWITASLILLSMAILTTRLFVPGKPSIPSGMTARIVPPRPSTLVSPTIGDTYFSRTALQNGARSLDEIASEQYSSADYDQMDRTFTYTIDLSHTETLIWSFGWCAASMDILTQNWQHIKLEFNLNGTPVSINQFATSQQQLDDRFCLSYYTALYKWGDGQHQLRTTVIFNAPINDGKNDFPAGNQIYNYTVHVNTP